MYVYALLMSRTVLRLYGTEREMSCIVIVKEEIEKKMKLNRSMLMKNFLVEILLNIKAFVNTRVWRG